MTLRNECPSFFSTFARLDWRLGRCGFADKAVMRAAAPISLDRAIDRPHRHHECERARSAAAPLIRLLDPVFGCRF